MAITDLPAQLEKNGLDPVPTEVMTCIEHLADTAFWQLMLDDDIARCQRNVDLLCAAIRFRWASVLIDISNQSIQLDLGPDCGQR